MKIYIKNMVSLRCKMLVEEKVSSLGFKFFTVDLGSVEFRDDVSHEMLIELRNCLLRSGLEILESEECVMIEKIKNIITEMVHYSLDEPTINYSDYISEKMDYDYTYLSTLFSKANGFTLQHFIILNKIEKIKELLSYKELNISEISYRLHYSSVGHLSYQFKKVTGLSPTSFRNSEEKRVCNLENI